MDRRKFLSASLASTAVLALEGPGLRASAQSPVDAISAELRERLAHDPLRPQFHLLPRHNWMNDPCAPRFHNGQYHMFFQYNPDAAVWGDMHWNHATSPDLIFWKHQPLALAPTRGSYDAYGCFTGSVLPDGNRASILYTGVTKCTPEEETIRGEGTREVQCLATAMDDDLRTWKKLDKPVIATPPAGMKVTGFRDPCPWKDGDTWYLGVGSGFTKVGGALLLYTSKDGRVWTYLHPLSQGKWNGGSETNPVDTGEMWECPDFFPLDGKHVLLYSTERKVYWEIGELDKSEMKFHMETRGLLDHGAYYAMKSMIDAKGRRILWGWVQEKRPDAELIRAGWSGCMALPRVLSIGPDNTLRMEVPPEFDTLRQDLRTLSITKPDVAVTNEWLGRNPIRNRAATVAYSFTPSAKPLTFAVHANGVDEALFQIAYNGDVARPALMVGDRTLSLAPDSSGLSAVQFWMDGSVIEIFADRKEAITLRNYTSTSGNLRLDAKGAVESLHSLRVSGVAPISADRLTS